MLKVIFYYLIVINLITFVLFGIDKSKAIKGSHRLSEKSLWFFSLIGGSAGAFLAMNFFKHKRRKASFIIIMLLILIAQVLLVIYLVNRYQVEEARKFILE